jgi:HK97 family phage portal protein
MLQLRSAPGWLRQAVDRFMPASTSRAPATKASRIGPLIAYEHLRQPAWTPRDYASFAREGFAQNAVVYRAVRMIAEAAASVPLLLYEGDAEITTHPLLDLIARPSPVSSAPDLLEAWYGFLLVSGNAYLEAVAVGGEIRELHALRPDRMKVIPGPDGWPEAFEYTAGGRSVRFAGETVPGVRPILHVKLFNPVNDHYGMSPIEAAATAIDIHNTAARWNKALLDNSARPSGALVYTSRDGNLTPEQYERLKAELEQGFQGASHAGRPLLLEGGLDWKSMSLSPKDMDFIEAKHAAAREIALALGVPPMLLGIPGDNTYSNYAEANRTFWRQTVLPLVNRTAKALSAWLGPAFSTTNPALSLSKGVVAFEFRPDLDAIEALSPEREVLWSRLDKGTFLTINEKRAAVGYGPVEGGDSPQERKFNPDQPRVPAGQPGGGRWTGDGGGGLNLGGDDRVRLVQIEGERQYSVNLDEEEVDGGHTIRDHVGKTDEYLLGEVNRVRFRVGNENFGFVQEGSFLSKESANDFVNRTLENNKALVDKVARGQIPGATLNERFGYVTGKEALKETGESLAYVRPTYDVRVRIRRDARSPRGYRVFTAFPRNRLPDEQ